MIKAWQRRRKWLLMGLAFAGGVFVVIGILRWRSETGDPTTRADRLLADCEKRISEIEATVGVVSTLSPEEAGILN